MEATLIHGIVDPRRLPEAVQSFRAELLPGFLGNPGARHGYWMADRTTGRLLILNVWEDSECMAAAAAVEGAHRATVNERVGVRTMAVQHMEVLGAHEETLDQSADIGWIRATWVSGLRPDRRRAVSPLYREVVPDQARSRGFCASYWLADPSVGVGLGLSCWEGPAEVREGEASSRRRRRRMEAVLGCSVVGLDEFEAVAVAAADDVAAVGIPSRSRGATPTRLRHVGTLLERPPGSLLAVSGERTDQVVVLVEGNAGLLHHDELNELGPGHHFGGRRVQERRRHAFSVLATSPVTVQVISRAEFRGILHDAPTAAAELVEGDAEPAESTT
jgi:hypothetical protein